MALADAGATRGDRALRRRVGARVRVVRHAWPFFAMLAMTGAVDRAHAERPRADVLFEEGRALLEAKDYAAACPKLAESHRLQPGGGSALALAICREGEGKTASAFAAYQDALFYAKRDKRKDREDHATAKLIELEPLLPKLRVVVSDAAKAQGVRVTIDRDPLRPALEGASAYVDPGEHQVEASAPGFGPRVVTLVASPGKSVDVVIEPLVAAPAAPAAEPKLPRPERAPERDGGGTRTAGLVVGAVGVVGVAVGTYFGLRALSLGSDVDRRCPTSPCGDLAAVDDNDRAHRYARISDWTLLGGGALVVTGAAMYLFGGSHAERVPQLAIGKDAAMIRWETRW
jgi:hypothetical protein